MLQRLVPLVVLFGFLVGASPLPAQEAVSTDEGMFTVGGVDVDVTASSSLDAREQAFAQGQRLAFERLLERLGVDRSQLDPASLSDVDMARLVQGFQVDKESTSAGRYIASLTYTFRPDEVRELLRGRAIEFVVTPSKPVVVIPVYRSATGPKLWDSPNPWLDAWLNVPGGQGLVPVIVPFGDLEDVQDVSIDEALAGDPDALEAIANRYDAGSTLVAIAEPQGETLAVTLNRHDPEAGDTTDTITVDAGADEAARLQAAVGDVTRRLDEAWRSQTRVQSGQRSTMAVLVPLTGGDSWFAIQRKLRQVPTVVATRVLSLSPVEAVLELDYIGSEDQFRLALAQQDLAIEQGPFAPQLRLGGAGPGMIQ